MGKTKRLCSATLRSWRWTCALKFLHHVAKEATSLSKIIEFLTFQISQEARTKISMKKSAEKDLWVSRILSWNPAPCSIVHLYWSSRSRQRGRRKRGGWCLLPHCHCKENKKYLARHYNSSGVAYFGYSADQQNKPHEEFGARGAFGLPKGCEN